MVEKQDHGRSSPARTAGAANRLRNWLSLSSLLSRTSVREGAVRFQRWMHRVFERAASGMLAALVFVNGLIAFAGPVAAQAGGDGGKNVCNTQMGGFITAVTSSIGTIAIGAILLAILVGVAARPFVRSGEHHSALNGIMSKAFSGLIILIIAIPVITWGLSFTPFAPSLSCIPFLGG